MLPVLYSPPLLYILSYLTLYKSLFFLYYTTVLYYTILRAPFS